MQNSKCRFWCRRRGNASFISLLNWTVVGLKVDLNLVLLTRRSGRAPALSSHDGSLLR